MALTSDGMSPADLAAVTGGMNNGGLWGGEGGAWWIIILFLFAFVGWGGNGFLGNGGGSGATENYVLTSDFASLERQLYESTNSIDRQLDNQNANICQNNYAQAQLMNGLSQQVTTSAFGIQDAITQAQIGNMQSTNALQAQLASNGCETREAIAGVNYNMAMNANATQQAISNGFCQTNFNNQSNTRDIVDAQNAGTQAILAKLAAMESNAKDEKIAEQAQQISALQLAASQANQNQYLVDQLAPKLPVAAYTVPNPFTGCGGGCGCQYA